MKIEPCPWCGWKKVDIDFHTPDKEGTPITVSCAECGAQGPQDYYKGTKEQMETLAILAWNTRK